MPCEDCKALQNSRLEELLASSLLSFNFFKEHFLFQMFSPKSTTLSFFLRHKMCAKLLIPSNSFHPFSVDFNLASVHCLHMVIQT